MIIKDVFKMPYDFFKKKKSVNFSVRIEIEELKKLSKIAESQGNSVGSQIRHAIKQHLQKYDNSLQPITPI